MNALGNASANITRWYDQSGNANDLVQTTQSYQPLIVNAGTLATFGDTNSRPAFYFDYNQPFYFTNGSFSFSSTTTVAAFVVFNKTANQQYSRLLAFRGAGILSTMTTPLRSSSTTITRAAWRFTEIPIFPPQAIR